MIKHTIHMLFVISIWGFSTPAEACSCIAKTQQQYFDQATDVFVGKANGVHKGKYVVDKLEVLTVLKGDPIKPFPVFNTEACDRTFFPYEIAIVFFHNNKVSICSGNYSLPNQLAGLIDLLKAAKAKQVPSKKVATSALQEVLLPYLHDRKKLFVTYGQASKEPVLLSKTEFPLVPSSSSVSSFSFKSISLNFDINWK